MDSSSEKCSTVGKGFNGAETNCGIAHILGILLMKSYCFYSVDNFTRISNYLRSIPFSSEFAKFTFLLKTTSCLSVYVSLRGTTSLPRHTPRLSFLFTMWFNLSVLILCFYILCKFISYLIFNLTCIFNSVFPFAKVWRNNW